jgi:hypothetical protein
MTRTVGCWYYYYTPTFHIDYSVAVPIAITHLVPLPNIPGVRLTFVLTISCGSCAALFIDRCAPRKQTPWWFVALPVALCLLAIDFCSCHPTLNGWLDYTTVQLFLLRLLVYCRSGWLYLYRHAVPSLLVSSFSWLWRFGRGRLSLAVSRYGCGLFRLVAGLPCS